MPTIRDVAKLAQVAPITASRVINNSGYTSKAVRERVLQAAEALGYVPNSLARSLRSKQTRILALVLTDITNPFWTTVARGVEDAASEGGFNVILCNTDESQSKQDQYLETLLQKQVDGILLVPAQNEAGPVRFIRQQGVPVVILDRQLKDIDVDVVRCDSEGGAYQLTKLLLSQGHRHIALLNGPKGVSSAEDRASGYRRAVLEAGIDPKYETVVNGEFSLESGFQMARDLMARQPRPSAIFAGNNFIAIGVLKALKEQGIAVPEEISVVGFDDLPSSLVVEPFLTVAAQPAYEMGTTAAKRLLALLSKQDVVGKLDTVLAVPIIERQSTQPYHVKT